jgi:hypothetical protein
MKAIIEELLDMAVHKLKKFEGGVCTNEGRLEISRNIIIEAHRVYQKGTEEWGDQRKVIIAERGSENLHALCLMFELTILHAIALAATRLIHEGFDPKADKRILLLDDSLKFGSSFSEAMG